MLGLWMIIILLFFLFVAGFTATLNSGLIGKIDHSLAILPIVLVMGMVCVTLGFLSLWPPFQWLTIIIILLFFTLLIGLLYFVRATSSKL